MTWNAKVWTPVVVLAVGLAATAGLIAARPEVPVRAPEASAPLIRTVVATARDFQLSVRAQGTVAPRTETDLVPEVSGRVTEVSPSLVAGGFFEAGDVLLKIDPREYRVAVEQAEAAVERRESEVRLADANLARSRSLARRRVVSDAALDEAQNAARVAGAAVREARAALEQARINLERAEIAAPFAGRVREERVDVGQVVIKGSPIAKLYAVDVAEIRLPIPDREIAFLDLPVAFRGETGATAGPEVTIRARFAGAEHAWAGRVVRTEGELDARTRVLHVVAQVADPYRAAPDSNRPPLAVGMFVDAEIMGRRLANVVVLPREAIRGADQVLVVDDDNRLRFRTVEVVRADLGIAVVRSGLVAGERVCLSALEAVVDGMQVRVVEDAVPAEKGSDAAG